MENLLSPKKILVLQCTKDYVMEDPKGEIAFSKGTNYIFVNIGGFDYVTLSNEDVKNDVPKSHIINMKKDYDGYFKLINLEEFNT